MKKLLILSFLVMSICLNTNAENTLKPTIKSKTSFAIITDVATYQKVKNAIDDYRKVIENDGLGTYVIYDEWKSPEQIRDILIKLHSQSAMKLEGAVFIGNIPIAMLRDAQHLTSAFKMNQKIDWKKSSVPSDRYYDDFGLKFKFLKQDSEIKDYFYYSLLPESDQHINCDIYTARIRPLEIPGTDKYQQIKDFLNKVVHERTTDANNPLDCLSMARGHGYNSEDEAAWAGEQIALREQLPTLFKSGSSVRFIDYASCYPAKYYYLNEVQRPGLDVMLFHHHGEYDTQYLNGPIEDSNIYACLENAKRYIRSKVPSLAKEKGKDFAIEQYMKAYDIPRSWCEQSFDSTKIKSDSLYEANMNIATTDIANITPSARFIMFDACFNGSFYQKDYIVGRYLFNNGTTLVAQGNTVNTIQDKWPDEMIGLLSSGMRIGEWHKHVNFLETHLLGDPTYHFAPTVKLPYNINEASVLQEDNAAFWRAQLKNQSPDVQCMALFKLGRMKATGLSNLLWQTYFNSPYMVVRLEALRQLYCLLDNNYVQVLHAALFDSYELTRRFAAKYVELYGSDEFASDIAKALITNYTDRRVAFNLKDALQACSKDNMKAALQKELNSTNLYYKKDIDDLIAKLDDYDKSDKANINEIMDTVTTAKHKRLDIVIYRNHPVSGVIDNLLKFVSDSNRPIDLRITTAEALGWYNKNSHRNYIINALQKINPTIKDSDLHNEITKTIHRLNND